MLRATVSSATRPSALRSSGSKPMPWRIASAGVRSCDRAAVARDRSGIASIGAGQHARQLAATGAEQTADADHFAGTQLEADVVQHAAASETLDA